jgi:hypothetical protein
MGAATAAPLSVQALGCSAPQPEEEKLLSQVQMIIENDFTAKFTSKKSTLQPL